MAFSSAVLTIIGRLKSYYNGNSYDATLNPGGFGAGGHRRNQIPAFQDISDVGVAIAGQADAAAGSAQTASDKATVATNMAGSATASAQAAADLYDQFDDRFLGVKSSDPAKDNDGNNLVEGALYWNNSSDVRYKGLRIFSGGIWNAGAFVLTSGVNTFNGRFGAVVPVDNDYSVGQIAGLADALGAKLNVAAKATVDDAQAATDNTKYMTPATVAAEVLALAGLFKKTTFTTGGTFTKDPRTKRLFVECVGAGGSGSCAFTGSGSVTLYGGGGCGGTYVSRWLDTADVGTNETVLVGAGGTGVGGSNSAGVAGGPSSFGSTVRALGGGGGISNSSNTTNVLVASPAGSGLTGNTSYPNFGTDFGYGSYGNLSNTGSGYTLRGGGGGGGAGGSSGSISTGGTSLRHGNGGTGAFSTNGTAVGGAGVAPGGGGGGVGSGGNVVNPGTSGAGARGEVTVWEFG